MNPDELAEQESERYEAELLALILLARQKKIGRKEFRERLNDLIESTLIMMFLLGGGNLRDRAELDRTLEAHRTSAAKLTRDVYSGNLADDTKMENRLTLWAVAAFAVLGLGKVHARNPSKMLRWVVGPTEHCSDCLRLNGQVHTAKAWKASGWRPQSRALECKGYRCQCQLMEVADDTPESGSF